MEKDRPINILNPLGSPSPKSEKELQEKKESKIPPPVGVEPDFKVSAYINRNFKHGDKTEEL